MLKFDVYLYAEVQAASFPEITMCNDRMGVLELKAEELGHFILRHPRHAIAVKFTPGDPVLEMRIDTRFFQQR